MNTCDTVQLRMEKNVVDVSAHKGSFARSETGKGAS